MIKTPLVAAAFCDVADGRLRLAQPVPVTPENMTFNDAPSPLEPGYTSTLAQVADLAISRSDNVATNLLFDLVGRNRATEIARDRLGLASTAFFRKLSGSDPLIDDPGWDGVHRNAHTAHDAALLFERIAIDDVPNADAIRGALARQYWNDKLSKGLRDGDRFAHKTGDTDDVTHDGGILTTAEGRTYVIVVYTGWASTDAHNARFGTFMRALRTYL
jgi:beta-lactamase class A